MSSPLPLVSPRLPGLGLILLAVLAGPSRAQEADRARLLDVARQIMAGARYAALITVDSTGAPQARTMEPLPPDSGFVVWIGTNPRTRKVAEIRRNPAVALYWFDPAVEGYVTLRGTAELVNDPAEKGRRWKPGWEAFYPDRDRDFLLIRVTPIRLEIVSPRQGVVGDSVTWRPPEVGWPPGRAGLGGGWLPSRATRNPAFSRARTASR